MNETKIICQNCGAEVIIPNHEQVINGVAIGKDSNLGTVVLATKNSTPCLSIDEQIEKLGELAGGRTHIVDFINRIMTKIDEGGYLDVNGIVRRWIPSQCLKMVYSKDGFFKALQRRGYDYTWKVLVNEFKKQAILYKHKDYDELKEREQWYNTKVVDDMAYDYIRSLRDYIDSLETAQCKGRAYKKIRCRWMNNGKGVFNDELNELYAELHQAKCGIEQSSNPVVLYDNVKAFDELRKQIKFTPKFISRSFGCAYKAAGCYYTIKDLIMFEGCKLKVDGNGSPERGWRHDETPYQFVNTQQSLEALEKMTKDLVHDGVIQYGYQMLGLLKDVLKYNEFDFNAAKAKWAEQSKQRKSLRNLQRNQRRSR